ncbi:MAG: hypothetical protein IID44_15675 [Planctomycetes bacterium]|nr:hypothetical protein [Planctomycetota bacterium]
MADRSTHAKSIFYRVIELEPGARAAQLDQSCAGDDDLRQEVESLLRFHDDDDDDRCLKAPIAQREADEENIRSPLARARLTPRILTWISAS